MKIRTWLAVAALTAAAAAPMSAQTPATGRVVADTVPAPSLAGNLLGDPVRQPAFVYLPPGYDAEPDRRYATIYLLHGVLDSPAVWVKPVYQGMTIQAAMDSLIAAGEIRPMIVVMPNGRNAYGGSFYMNSPVGGNWGDFISRDLVAYVDSTYRTLARPESRAIAGHSMGGFGALRLAMLHPDVFSVAWGMSPCCLCCVGTETPADHPVWREMGGFDSAEEMWEHLDETDDPWPLLVAGSGAAFAPDPDRPPLYFDPLYRVEGDSVVPTGALAREAAALPLAEVAAHVDDLKRLRGFAFDDGYADQFPHIPRAVHAFSDSLFALGVPHVFEMYAGDHRDRIGERLPGRILPWLDARLAHGPVGPR